MVDPQRNPTSGRIVGLAARHAFAAARGEALQDAARAVARFVDERRVRLALEGVAAQAPAAIVQRLGGDTPVVVVAFDLSGAVTGGFAQVLIEQDAPRLAALVVGKALSVDDAAGLIAEMGNIAASAFLNRLAGHLGGACLPSVPRLFRGTAATTVPGIFAADDEVGTLSLRLGDVPLLLATTPMPVGRYPR